jgi:hypothetical protein
MSGKGIGREGGLGGMGGIGAQIQALVLLSVYVG